MVATNKPSVRSTGRAPPFILVGFVLLSGFLGYNYWSLTRENASLAAELETVEIEKRDVDQIYLESEKKLANARGNLIEAKENVNQANKQVQMKVAELAKLKTDLGNKQADVGRYQTQLSQCDASVAELNNNLDVLKNEKANLEKLLQEEKAKPIVCDKLLCKDSVKEILLVTAKLLGSEVLSRALSEAKFDAATLMEGITFPVPVVQQPKVNSQQPQSPTPNQQQQAPNQQQQAPNQQQEVPNQKQGANEIQKGKGNHTESNKSNDKIMTMKVDDILENITQADADKKTSGSLVFQSDGHNNTDMDQQHVTEESDKEEGENDMDEEAIARGKADTNTTGIYKITTKSTLSTVNSKAQTDKASTDDEVRDTDGANKENKDTEKADNLNGDKAKNN